MAITKKEFSAVDSAPAIQYAKQDADSDKAYPITATQDGDKIRLDVTTGLSSMPGFNIPPFDRIDATYPSDTQEIYVYTLTGATVTTLTVNYTDSTKRYISSSVKS